jgi:adenosine deaminase
LEQGLLVCVNSDDPAYFGGYIGKNYEAITDALDLSADQIIQLARNSFTGSFLPEADKARHLAAIEDVAASLA